MNDERNILQQIDRLEPRHFSDDLVIQGDFTSGFLEAKRVIRKLILDNYF